MASIFAYDPDTVVVDLPEDRPARPLHAELTMQVHHDDGAWHRRTPDLSMTACGMPLYRLGQALRVETYAGPQPLCRTCFTPFELAIHDQLMDDQRKRNT
jgi:hypothetical protein